MPECEICGRVIDRPKKILLEGVVLNACNNCSRLGKPVKSRRRKVKIKRSAPLPKIEEVKPKELVSDFSKIIREKRETMKLMQKDVALKLNLPLSLVKRSESGFRPEDSVIRKFERFYGISLFEDEE
ncbi:MAG: TIGR00270 family protein [Candidatus Micrarchaeota archaeon]|nr:TIGR00270 family protein [Candidatus Micrarchaeota archaeon]